MRLELYSNAISNISGLNSLTSLTDLEGSCCELLYFRVFVNISVCDARA
jgi:hypothetical protein